MRPEHLLIAGGIAVAAVIAAGLLGYEAGRTAAAGTPSTFGASSASGSFRITCTPIPGGPARHEVTPVREPTGPDFDLDEYGDAPVTWDNRTVDPVEAKVR